MPPQGNPYENRMPMGPVPGGPGMQGPQGKPYENGMPAGQLPGGSGMQVPQGNPYQNGMPTGPVPGSPGMQAPQGNPYQNGAFSGVPQDVVERAEKTDFVPYEKIERKEEASEHKGISEPLIVDSEQDAGIVLEAAEEVLKLEERAEAMPGAAAQIPQEESGGIVAEKDGDREAFQDINEEENADSSKL